MLSFVGIATRSMLPCKARKLPFWSNKLLRARNAAVASFASYSSFLSQLGLSAHLSETQRKMILS